MDPCGRLADLSGTVAGACAAAASCSGLAGEPWPGLSTPQPRAAPLEAGALGPRGWPDGGWIAVARPGPPAPGPGPLLDHPLRPMDGPGGDKAAIGEGDVHHSAAAPRYPRDPASLPGDPGAVPNLLGRQPSGACHHPPGGMVRGVGVSGGPDDLDPDDLPAAGGIGRAGHHSGLDSAEEFCTAR